LGLGDDKVIHYSGLADDLLTPGVIQEISLDGFTKGKEISIKPDLIRIYTLDEAIIRARFRKGEAQYHILHNNCEHFVEWCISGKHRSQQSTKGKILYSAGVGARALVGVKNPTAFLAGAAAGYVYINRQGLKKLPDFEALEKAFQTKITPIYLPFIEDRKESTDE
jgi:hypothetical protein